MKITAKRRKQLREADKRYRERNREKLRKKMRFQDRKRGKTKARKQYKYEWNKQFREGNRKQVRDYSREYSRKNHERDKQKKSKAKKKYNRSNPDKVREWKQRQRENISPGYINELLRDQGISPYRSKEFNETYALKLKINRILKKKKMKNIVELRNELKKVFTGVKSGNLKIAKAKELNNVASKIMQSVSIEMKREQQTGRKRTIDFVDNGISYNKAPKAPVANKKKK